MNWENKGKWNFFIRFLFISRRIDGNETNEEGVRKIGKDTLFTGWFFFNKSCQIKGRDSKNALKNTQNLAVVVRGKIISHIITLNGDK